MHKNNLILSSMAMDLKRAAIGWHRGSDQMAERFFQEVTARKKEIDENYLKGYMKKIISDIEIKLQISDNQEKAERALMYSILIQNFVLKGEQV